MVNESFQTRISAFLSNALADGARRRGALDGGIADAIIVADPVDPTAAALDRAAVAEVDLPGRRLVLPGISDRPLHRVLLALDAAFLPLADEADVQKDGIAQRRQLRLGGCGSANKDRNANERQLQARPPGPTGTTPNAKRADVEFLPKRRIGK